MALAIVEQSTIVCLRSAAQDQIERPFSAHIHQQAGEVSIGEAGDFGGQTVGGRNEDRLTIVQVDSRTDVGLVSKVGHVDVWVAVSIHISNARVSGESIDERKACAGLVLQSSVW